MDYTVTFAGERRGRHSVWIKGASCASEAESMARAQCPEHADKPIMDICRKIRSANAVPAGYSRTKLKELPE